MEASSTILDSIVIDDSSIQRFAIVNMIKNHPNLRFIGEYKNYHESIEGIGAQDIDLIFLDVELPERDGFDLLDEIDSEAGVIFITGQSKYAKRAFDYSAIDYLQKPIKKERFLYSVEKALITKTLRAKIKREQGEFIFVKSNFKRHKVYLKQLKYIEALGDYIKLHMEEEEPLVVLSTMKGFLKKLPGENFMRIHKSYIVNLNKINKFTSKQVELRDDTLALSRTYKLDLYDALKPGYSKDQ